MKTLFVNKTQGFLLAVSSVSLACYGALYPSSMSGIKCTKRLSRDSSPTRALYPSAEPSYSTRPATRYIISFYKAAVIKPPSRSFSLKDGKTLPAGDFQRVKSIRMRRPWIVQFARYDQSYRQELGSHSYTQVLEETGFNIKDYASEENCISVSIYSQVITLYIVHPVPEDTVFETRTRKEISVSPSLFFPSPGLLPSA